MQKPKLKGIKYFIIFLLLIFLIRPVFSSTEGNVLQKVRRELNASLGKIGFGNFTGKDYLTNVITQEVVQEESSVINVVEKVSPAVVSVVIKTVDFDFFSGPITDQSGIGTGFIIDKSGLIVTNSHVVDSEQGQYSVVLGDGTSYEVQKIHLDRYLDIAILEIDAENLEVVSLGDSEKIKVGQRAIAIGNALGQFQNTVTVGVISGVARELSASGASGIVNTYENAIQTDAALNPGNSGGPLLNSAGQVVGINVATTRGADNVSFAIPVNTLKPILESFLREGRIVKPYIGVSYVTISKEIASLRRMPEGAFISMVLRDSPAGKAGLQVGDIVVSVDGVKLESENSLSRLIQKKKVGDTIAIEIDRNGEQKNMKITLEEMPEDL